MGKRVKVETGVVKLSSAASSTPGHHAFYSPFMKAISNLKGSSGSRMEITM